ncbi:MAG: S9 family peptidase [Thiotrichales bacterium]
MTSFQPKSEHSAPRPVKHRVQREVHGVTLSDDYAWLRDSNWKEMFKDAARLDPAIRVHLEAENAYVHAMMDDTAALRRSLFAELKGRIKEDDSSVPAPDGPHAYGVSYRAGGEQPRYFRTPRDGGEPEILLDGDHEAAGKAYFRLASADHSPDHAKLLWGHDDKGSEFYELRVRDLASGTELPDRVADSDGGGAWDAVSAGFFYARLDENHRSSSIHYHALGTAAEADRLVYQEPDPGFFMGVRQSRLNDWILLDIHDHETSEYHLIPAAQPDAVPRLVQARETGVEYDLEEGGEEFFILTNADGAKDFKIVTAPVATPQRAHWRDLVAHQPGRLILEHQAYREHLVWLERVDGLPRIIVKDRASGAEHAIAFAEDAYALGLLGSDEYDTHTIRYSYSSMTTPTQQYEYDLRTRARHLLKTQEIPSGHDPAHYVTSRIHVRSHDGAEVPVSLLQRRDTPRDGTAPCLLYGYGAYGITIPATFNSNCLSLVDRGFVYAIAHVRGGKDKGFAWYEDGKRAAKRNTFLDFIAVARHLVEAGYTCPDRLIAQGGSAGGILMGAVANLAPDAFAGIIAEVPFVDVLNTMLDETLPLTPPEWPEWGNPIESAADFATIAAYSPYDNVTAQAYPAILAEAGLTDPRVTYWEPAKWVARLREHQSGTAPILFKVNMDAGHAGASGRFSRLEEVAFNYAFALKVVGLEGESPAFASA